MLVAFWLKLNGEFKQHNDVGHYALGASTTILKKFSIARISLWCMKKKMFTIWTNSIMMEMDCCHLHYVVGWVSKLLINPKLWLWTLHCQHHEAIQTMSQNQPKTHTQSYSFPRPSIRNKMLFLLFQVYVLEFINAITYTFKTFPLSL